MFDDPKKELEALEKQLLKDEAWFEKELDSAKRMIGQNPRKSSQATAQAPKAAVKTAPAETSGKKKGAKKKAPAPKKKSNKGLLILMLLETLGILGLGAYWVLFLLK